MASYEIMVDVEHYTHELSQIEVSKADKLKPEKSLSIKEMTGHRGALGSFEWLT